jgi:hypothetical protein
MNRTQFIVLSVVALVGYSAFNDARHEVVEKTTGAIQSRCAAFAANDLDCPYSTNK